ncbi:hypothetical protein TD95_005236 [Thielaviopsis punctulata]|uniref:SAC domain-containing protein n=1 Tax=Thielaviopsis punctulata TaxID=72032 RepID=A0A0F4ZDR4_9PEZI|nr:hypothetical protein TD95_005236 [Thielaviopsis punctulata]
MSTCSLSLSKPSATFSHSNEELCIRSPPDSLSTNADSLSIQSSPDDVDNAPVCNLSCSSLALPASSSAASSLPPDNHFYQMYKYTLYETATRYYIVGCDVSEKHYRILKIARNHDDDKELSIADDKTVYNYKEMNQLLETIDDGNKPTGGIRLRCPMWGIVGFIRFTGPYYMHIITKKSTVAVIGGHRVYQIEGTELISLTISGAKSNARNTEESRFLATYTALDLTRCFYFSYSYDISHTLQHNIAKERERLVSKKLPLRKYEYNSMFVWNSFLIKPVEAHMNNPWAWCCAIIHGYLEQRALNVFGRIAHITLIARRSRHFAGVRFLKRGVTTEGYVANEVETEQIVSESVTTSFHGPGPELFSNPHYTSYVQHRGSIPLSWTQDASGVSPKPPIHIQASDPFYAAAALHFNDLFRRYGNPIYVLNLVKARERIPRESMLLDLYLDATDYLNQHLPENAKIIHKAWDMSRASKSRDQDVILTLEKIAEEIISMTGLFHNGDSSGMVAPAQVQNGIVRTNCVDCLDRTNAAQFVIGKRVLGHQLHVLGILADTAIEYDTDAIDMLTDMYHEHGDTIAMQYAGSQLVNTVETYRKTSQWSNPRDMIESFKRFYNNSFLDAQRQQTYNLFLGNYVYDPEKPLLWDLLSDWHLHNPELTLCKHLEIKDYINWFTPKYLETRQPALSMALRRLRQYSVEDVDEYWLENYRPLTISSFDTMFAMKMKSSLGDGLPPPRLADGTIDFSPFRVRVGPDADGAPKRSHSKPATSNVDSKGTTRGISLHRWLRQPILPDATNTPKGEATAAGPSGSIIDGTSQKLSHYEKFKFAQSTFAKAVNDSLDPVVSSQEEEDYFDYVSHPQNLPLVVSSDLPAEVEPEYFNYVHYADQFGGLDSVSFEQREAYEQVLDVGDDPLNVTEGDIQKKRYKAYRKWLQGKSFFKQHPAVDPTVDWPLLE